MAFFLFRARYFDPKMANIGTIFLCCKKWSNRKNKATFTSKKFRAHEVKVTFFCDLIIISPRNGLEADASQNH